MIKGIIFLFGIIFGYILIMSGVSHYDVIRDMFLLRSWHLYGVLGVAVPLSFIGITLLKKAQAKTLVTGEPLDFTNDTPGKQHVMGGLLGGAGWAITGACPGPAIALVGFGTLSGIFIVIGTFLGTYLYGLTRDN